MMIQNTSTTSRKRILLVCLFAFLFVNQVNAQGIAKPFDKKVLLSQLIKLNDESIPRILVRQISDKDNEYYGVVFDNDSVVSPIGTSNLIQTLMCSYVSRDSKYYQSKEMLHRLTMAATGLLSLQHEDGTIDLLSTNFHSTPDLGFTIYPLALAYSIMLQNS
jgi:hypothetical protein